MRDSGRGTGHASISLPRPGVLAPVAGILLGEALLFGAVTYDQGFLRASLFVHLVTFLGCVLAPLRSASGRATGLYFSLSLVPMSRLAATGLPDLATVPLVRYAVAYAVLVPALLLVESMESTPSPALGQRALLVVGPFFLPLAVALAAGEWLASTPEAIVPSALPAWLFLSGTVFVFVVGPIEELLFRGFLQTALEREVGGRRAVGLASVVYGAVHAESGSLAAVGVGVLAGAFLGTLYARSGSLALVATLNGVMGFVTFVALPLWL